MSSFTLNLKIEQGATFSKQVTWKAGEPALPVDLTGCSARMQIRQSTASEDVRLALSTAGGGIALGGAAGTVALRVEAAVTALMSWASAVYDLEIEFSDGTVRRLLAGTVSVSPEVTRGA